VLQGADMQRRMEVNRRTRGSPSSSRPADRRAGGVYLPRTWFTAPEASADVSRITDLETVQKSCVESIDVLWAVDRGCDVAPLTWLALPEVRHRPAAAQWFSRIGPACGPAPFVR